MLENSENAGLRNWATKENLRRAAETYNQMVESGIYSIEALENRIKNVGEQHSEIRKSLKDCEQRQKELNETVKYLKQYQNTETVYKQYKGAYFKDRFFRNHEQAIIIHGAAKNYLKQQGIDLGRVTEEQLNFQIDNVIQRKNQLKSKAKVKEKNLKVLRTMRENMRLYLQAEEPERGRLKLTEKYID